MAHKVNEILFYNYNVIIMFYNYNFDILALLVILAKLIPGHMILILTDVLHTLNKL